MLRLEFSAADLGRVRVANAPHPLWELILGINSWQSPDLPPRYWEWRSAVRGSERRNEANRRVLAAAKTLVPVRGNFPDFLTPDIGSPDLETHLDAILSTPHRLVQDDLVRTFRYRPAPAWARALYRHGRTGGLVKVLRRCHALLLEPVRRAGGLQVEAERARFAGDMLDGGTERLLRNLHSSIRWKDPVLEGDYPFEWTIRLDGRGLVVVPARFCWGAPVSFIDAERPPVLVVPACADRTPLRGAGEDAEARVDRLGRLLGATRARILAELAGCASTTELAKRLAVSPAAISQHTRVLREARLITTERFGMSVRHALTPLARDLMCG